jgi:hypothetical protein
LFGGVYTRDDLGAFHLPVRAFYAGQLTRGESFDWMPQLFSGFYLAGEGQAGTYHPLHLVLYGCLPLTAAAACELLASYPFMLAGMYLFLRRHVAREAALFGSLVFTFSGFNLLHFVHPNAIAVVAHVPWLLWSIDKLLTDADRRRRRWAHTAVALLTGSQLLLGYPQYVWLSLLIEGAYACLVVTGPRSAQRRARRAAVGSAANLVGAVRPWCLLLAAKGVGVLVGAVQLLPTADALSRSVRGSADAEFLNSGSMHPLNLVQLVAPYLFTHRVVGQNTHELALYVGAVPLLLTVWLLTRRKSLGRLRRLAVAATGLGLLALLLAFGGYGPLYRMQQFLPWVGKFRFPCRYVMLFYLGVAVTAAIAFDRLARHGRRSRQTVSGRHKALWTVAVVAALAALFGLWRGSEPFIASPAAVLAGPALIALAVLVVTEAARGKRWALAGLVLLAAADLGYYGIGYAGCFATRRLDAYAAQAKTPPGEPRERVWLDLADAGRPVHTGNQMTLAGWSRADGYAGLQPARKLDYRCLSSLRAAGVRWVRRSPEAERVDGLVACDGDWLEVPDPLERVRLVTDVHVTANPARDVATVPLESTALVEKPLSLPTGVPGRVTAWKEGAGRFHIWVECPTTQLLVVSESYHPGWEAEVDGRPRSVLRANGDFLGCVIHAGERSVVLRFRPESLHFGRLASCLGLMLVSVSVLGGLVGPGKSQTEGMTP